MLQKQKKILIIGFLLILFPPLFIFASGIPTLTELFGLGEGFAYMLAYFLFFMIFAGMILVNIVIFKAFFKRGRE